MGFERSGAATLVGRDQEVDRLSRYIGLDRGSASGLVLLSGDAGIGKTRLLAEVAARATTAGWTVLVGHCLGEAGQSLPYLPFTEMLGRLESTSPEAVDRLLKHHPHLTGMFPGRRRAGDPVPDAVDRSDLVEAAHAALEDMSRIVPLLLVIEDVHWADQSSRDLLTLLFTRGFSGPVAIIASYRSDDLHRRHPLRSTLAHWSRLADVQRLDLAPLPDRAVRQLVSGLQRRPLAEHVVRTVVERAEGNAFFAEELVAATALGQSGVAEDLSRLLLVRFDQLGTAGQHVVRMASAAGRHVDHALLAEVVGLSAAELDEGLRDAVEHHVLLPTDSGGYAFRHALLGETVYDDLLPGERVRAHERYAAVLAADRELGSWAELARHAEAAGDRSTALDAGIHAAEAALSMGGPQDAWRHYQQALSLLPERDERLVPVTLAAARTATITGRAHKAVHLLQERINRWPAGADPVSRAELLGELAVCARLTENTIDTLACTKEALSLLDAHEGPSDDRIVQIRARLLGAHVQALADRGRDDEATQTATEAVDHAAQAGLPEVADEIHVITARILERTGDPDTSMATLERIIADSSGLGDPAQVRALHHLGSLHHRAGRLDKAVEVYTRGVTLAARAGRSWSPYAFECRLLSGVAAYEAGRWDEALKVLDTRGERAPQPADAMLGGARLYVAAGRGSTGWEADAAQARPWWETDGLVAVLAGTAVVDLLGDRGDLEAAIAMHDEVVAFLSELWHPHFQAQLRLSALLLGQFGTHLQRLPTAERADLLHLGEATVEAARTTWEHGAKRGHAGLESQAWRARAEAEWLRLQWVGGARLEPDALVSAWQDAVRGFEASGHVFEIARSRARLGAALKASGDSRSAAELRASLEVAQRLGAEPLRAEIRAIGGARSAPRPASRQGEALTAREREILALVALGRSNRQIGTQLFISGKTASVHVSNILAKLGVAGRGEAVAVARERGLLD